jgi:hypothetical protein
MENRMKFDHGTNAAMSYGRSSHGQHARISMRDRRFDLSGAKEFKLQELAMLSISPIVRSIHHWWLQRAERHFLICADVEEQRAREAQMNVAYYQKRAALARSARY